MSCEKPKFVPNNSEMIGGAENALTDAQDTDLSKTPGTTNPEKVNPSDIPSGPSINGRPLGTPPLPRLSHVWAIDKHLS